MAPEARSHLEAALAATRDPAQQLALTLELAAVDEQQGRLPDAVARLEATLSQLDTAGADESLRALLAANAAVGRLFGLLPVPRTALDDLDLRLDRLEPEGWLARMVAGVLAAVHGFGSTQDTDRVAAHCRHALGSALPRELMDRPAALGALPIASSIGLHELVLEAVDVAAVARLTGSRWATAAVATWRALALHAAGRLAEAEAEAAEGADGFGDDVPVGHAAAISVLALVVLARHGSTAAVGVLDRLGQEPLAVPPALQGCMVLRARARVSLASHDPAAARSAAERLRDMIAEADLEEPALLGWRRDLALSLHRQGEQGGEELATEHFERCRAGGIPALVADACVVLAETGDPAKRGERLERAVAEAERGGQPLVLADALAAHGSHLRRTGAPAAAREPLQRALRIYDGCGAGGLRGHAHDELAATGVRPARPRDLARHRLTPSELRTARLAADGLTNRDIALALFVTPKTVETHLHSVFRKLGISSRRELPVTLAAT
jgi:DNA-binding CsgD family transcriptional regulator